MLQNFTYYVKFVLHMLSILLYKSNVLFLLCYLSYKIMNISSLSSSSTARHTISNSSMYVYKHFELIFAAFATLCNTCFNKIITTNSLKYHNPVKSVHFTQILLIVLTIFAYYTGIMLNAFAFLLCSKLCWHNRLKPRADCSIREDRYDFSPLC